MSDEEESMSEGFSASEDEWKPSREAKGGESSDDDDSDFEESPVATVASGGNGAGPGRKKCGEPKARSATKQTASKKRAGLSLRAKLYNKYRPLPKTFSPPSSVGKNSPSASTSRTNPKNAKTPNESSGRHRHGDGEEGSTSDGSIDNYLVKPEEIDLQFSFFNVDAKTTAVESSLSPVPDFDCNAGLGNLSDSESEAGDNNDSGNFHKEDVKAFDFRYLLENANSLERAKESIAKRTAEEAANKKTVIPSKTSQSNIDTLDVFSVLTLGEKQHHRSHNDGEDEDDEEEDEEGASASLVKAQGKNKGPPKLSKTKSTRVKRHTKTRPASTVVEGGDTDDSEFEEVADTSEHANPTSTIDISNHGSLEIHVELPSRHREKKTKTQQEIENALKRKINREMKDRQLLLHKASLLCLFGRSYFYNRLLNDTILMQNALKLLPSNNAYPPERGTEIKYYQSLVTWFKNAINLSSQDLYPDKKAAKTKNLARKQLQKQIEKKQARSKQDMIFIFIILLRGMGIQCRLVVNMQPLPLKPAQSDLLSIKLKTDRTKDTVTDDDPSTSSKTYIVKQKSKEQDIKEKGKERGENAKKISNNGKKDLKPSLKSSSVKSLKVENDKKEIVGQKLNLQSKSKKANNETSREENTRPILGLTEKLSKKEVDQEKPNTLKNETATKTRRESEETAELCRPRILKQQKHEIECISIPAAGGDGKNAKSLAKFANKKINHFPKHETENVRKEKTKGTAKNSTSSDTENLSLRVQPKTPNATNESDALNSSQKENTTKQNKNLILSRLKRTKAVDDCKQHSRKKSGIELGSTTIPTIIVKGANDGDPTSTTTEPTRATRSRSKSPQVHISAAFLQSKQHKEKFPNIIPKNTNVEKSAPRGKNPVDKIQISVNFVRNSETKPAVKRILRSRQKTNEAGAGETNSDPKSPHIQIPQVDGAEDEIMDRSENSRSKRKPNQKKVNKHKSIEGSDEDFEPSPIKRPKKAPTLAKKDRRVLSTDDEISSPEQNKRKATAGDMWIEVWSDVEEQWVCVDLFKGKIHCVDTIRKSASSNLSYVFAFQNDLSIKDVTARYCPNWTTVVRKSRIEKAWLDTAIFQYLGNRTKRDIKEDQEMRRIHEEKPMPTAISDYKNHPFYALERHLLKFEAIYPPEAAILGYIRGEAVYSRDCIHTLHSRDIWLKQARVVKLGEKPYKIVKARPKWDRITQTVIKDQPLEIFGYWQTEDYDPPTAENGIVPRNAYGNVELFKPTMLPKKCVHIRLPGLNRICKKLEIDCANAVVGFDFHQGACHPTFDGFIVCEEFADQVTAAWYQDQEEQELKQQEKYEARVYGNWKKLIRGLLIRERLKLKYNF